jgi:predicted mannosyl-3-phosphoglycerate phosphatase (HAD superfamily)
MVVYRQNRQYFINLCSSKSRYEERRYPETIGIKSEVPMHLSTWVSSAGQEDREREERE